MSEFMNESTNDAMLEPLDEDLNDSLLEPISESLYPFVNTTNYDINALKALNDLAEKSVRKQMTKPKRILSGVIGVACLALGGYMMPSHPFVGAILLVYGVLLFLMCISWKSFHLKSSQRQLQRNAQVCTCEFSDDEIICNTDAFQQRFTYKEVFAVVTDQQWYAIFMDKNHGIILNRDGFTQGDPAMFKAFIGQHTKLPIQEV